MRKKKSNVCLVKPLMFQGYLLLRKSLIYFDKCTPLPPTGLFMTSFGLCGSSVKINLDNSLSIGSEGVGIKKKKKKPLYYLIWILMKVFKIGQMKKSRSED